MTAPVCAAYFMLLWFWGSSKKRAYFAAIHQHLSLYLKVNKTNSHTWHPTHAIVIALLGAQENAFLVLVSPNLRGRAIAGPEGREVRPGFRSKILELQSLGICTSADQGLRLNPWLPQMASQNPVSSRPDSASTPRRSTDQR